MSYYLKPDKLTKGVITRILEDGWKGNSVLAKKDLKKIHQVLLEQRIFGEEAREIHVPIDEKTEKPEDKIKSGFITKVNREYNPENTKYQIVVFPHLALVLKEDIYGSAFGKFNYIYRAKGIRIFWFDSGSIEYRTVYSTIDEDGFLYSTEEVDERNIFEDNDFEDLINTPLEDAFGTGEILISNLIGIKENFTRDYVIEYLLYPRDVDRLSSFSIQLREQIWDAIMELITGISISTSSDKESLFNYLIKFVEDRNIQPKAYHLLSLFDFYRENQMKIDRNKFEELLTLVRKNSKPEESIIKKINTVEMIEELEGLKSGVESANKYHDLIFRCLTQVFDKSLKRGKKEVSMDNGRKRVDIVFDNHDTSGFFAHIQDRNQIFCPKIFIECKNYSSDPANPEVDQLIGRLGDNTGKFGILICRQVKNEDLLMERCKAAMNNNRGHIIYLVDEDIKRLLRMKEKSDEEGIFDYLSNKWDRLILGN